MKELKPVAIITTDRYYRGLTLSSTGLLAARGEALDIFDLAEAFNDHAPYLPEPSISLPKTLAAQWATWSPDGRYLACVTTKKETGLPSQVTIFDVAKRECLIHHDHDLEERNAVVDFLAWSPDGKYIASTTEKGQLYLLSADSGETIHTRSMGYLPHFLCWSADSHILAVRNTKENTSTYSSRAYVELWDVHNATNWERLTCLHDDDRSHSEGDHVCSTFSPDGRFLALGTTMGYIQLWSCDLMPPVKCRILDFHQHEVMHLVWHDNRYLISVGADNHILVWNTRSWEIVYHLGSRKSLIVSITCYQNYVVLVNMEGTVSFYHLAHE